MKLVGLTALNWLIDDADVYADIKALMINVILFPGIIPPDQRDINS